MKNLAVRNFVAGFISLAMVHASAAPATIGIATAKGSFRVDDSYVAGNATLFDGVSVETGTNTGELNLSKTRVAMAADTRGRVFQDRLILDHGKVQWAGSAFRTLVGDLQIVGVNDGSKALVVRQGETVQVASLAGTVNVLSTSGDMVMEVAAGNTYDFTQEPQGASPGDKKDPAVTGKKKAVGVAAVTKVVVSTAVKVATSTVGQVAIGVAIVAASGTTAAVLATRDSGTSASR